MGFRDFKPCKYWLSQINTIDRLEITNYEHGEAHLIAKEFFLKNPQYTHFLFLCEDNIITPSHIALILEDAQQFKDAVVCGYSNVQWDKDEANISFRNLKNIVVYGREAYQHPRIEALVTGQWGFPFVRVWFQGNTLACYSRSVVEKLSFKPYRYMRPQEAFRLFKVSKEWGIMQDLQMCIELNSLGIPIICDLRLFVPHFTQAPTTWNLVGKPRTVILHRKDGSTEKIREDEPYQ